VILNEMVRLFIDSRRRGTTGARRKCSSKTVKIYEDNLRVFENYLQTEVKDGGLTRYESIRRLHIVGFLDWLEKKESSGDWAKATALQILRTLRTFFRWVDLDEDCQLYELKGLQKYLPAIVKNPRRLDIPQLSDMRSFKNGFNTDDTWEYRDFVATGLMLSTGIRLGEVCNIKLNEVLFDQKLVVVIGKTGPRPISLSTDVLLLIKGWLKRRVNCRYAKDSEYLFVSKRASQMTVGSFGQSFRKHRIKKGLPRITAHTMRHLFATNWLNKGGDMEKLRLMTGHTSYEMLKDYLHVTKIGSKSMQKEVERVNLLKEL
jgi:site-specific recombinase XerD